MRDHELKEHPVEIGAAGRGKSGHLLGRRHARHARHHLMAHPAGVMLGRLMMRHARMVGGVGRMFAALREPILHELDLIVLARQDAACGLGDLRIVGPAFDEIRHLHGLVMVMDHALHELDIGVDVGGVRDAARFLCAQRAGGLPGGAGLDDPRVLRGGRCGQRDRQEAGAGGEEMCACHGDGSLGCHSGRIMTT